MATLEAQLAAAEVPPMLSARALRLITVGARLC